MVIQKVDILLSCGHIQIVSFSKEIEFGESYYCETCKKIEKIQNVGESWSGDEKSICSQQLRQDRG